MLTKLLPGVPTWSAEDGAALRAFLLTNPGQRFLQQLLHLRPGVIARDREDRMSQSDQRAGYEACFGDIQTLADPGVITEQDRRASDDTIEQIKSNNT